MKKPYSAPELTVEIFDDADILSTSGFGSDIGWGNEDDDDDTGE